jgi:hypothetical protein
MQQQRRHIHSICGGVYAGRLPPFLRAMEKSRIYGFRIVSETH